MKYGYARVSTDDQHADMQNAALSDGIRYTVDVALPEG
jgi:DNA invertase Pin-like site-specific DNA recombinase